MSLPAAAATQTYKAPQHTIRWYRDFCKGLPSMRGKNVVITGTTSGTGLIAAKTLAGKGAYVFLLNRPSDRASAALAGVRSACNESHGTGAATPVECDLQDFESVREAAAALEEMLAGGSLFALVNNAGVMALPEAATKDGYDVQMQTNHLSHFLLSSLMLPALERGAAEHGEARIVNHTSGARNMEGRLERKYFEKRVGELGGIEGRWVRYHQSKLANSSFTLALQAALAERGSRVKAVCAHPGVSPTGLGEKTVMQSAMENDLAHVMAMEAGGQSVEDGTLPLLAATCMPDAMSGDLYGPGGVEGPDVPTGDGDQFLGPPKKMKGPETLSKDEEGQQLLWAASEAAIGQAFF